MKKLLIATALVFGSFAAVADSAQVTHEDLYGQYTLIGNMGFLHYEIELGPDREATLVQYGHDGPLLSCRGLFLVDEDHLFTAVYQCKSSGDVFTHEFSLKNVSCGDLLEGVTVDLIFKGQDVDRPVKVEFKRK